MKKQILFMTFLSLAFLFAGVNKVFGQVDIPYLGQAPASCPIPTPLTNCADGDQLHPVAGVSYEYIIDHTGGAGSVVHWFVADDTTPLITNGGVTATIDPGDGLGDYILTTTGAVYNQGVTASTPNTSASIDITWKAFDGTTNNVVLVAFVTDADGCTNNIQAWKIEPQYSFIIEIAGIMPDGTFDYGTYTNANECVSPVQSAVWNGTDIVMDYGDNYIFYNVTAANWVHGWLPSFIVDDTGTLSTVGTVEWAYAHEANSTDPTVWHSASDPVLASEYSFAVNDAIGPDGACIVLRVLVTHDNNEIATAPETVTVSVDGLMYNPGTDAYDNVYPDLDDSTNSGEPCEVGSNDSATYELTPRPDITPNTPTDPFVPKN